MDDKSNKIKIVNKANKYTKKSNLNKSFNSNNGNSCLNIIKNKNKKNIPYNNINIIKNKNNENINNIDENKNKTKNEKNALKEANKDKVNKCTHELNLKFDYKVEYKRNPLEEYDEMIMKNLFEQENINKPDYTIFLHFLKEEKEITKRYSCINLANSLCETFELRQETFYLSINLFDRYIQKIQMENKLRNINPKSIMLTCVFISSKYEEIYPPLIDDYLQLFNSISKNEIFKLENDILSKLNFELHICSSYLFLTKFFGAMEKSESRLVFYGAQFILDLCLISPEFCKLRNSFQSAICLYLSKKFLSSINEVNKIYKNKIWTAENEFKTGYSEIEIKKGLKLVLKIIKEFFMGNIVKDFDKTSFFKKYSEQNYLDVAHIMKDLCLNNK